MSRITKKIENPQYMNDYDQLCNHSYTIINKLGKLEDIMEKHHIRDIEHLDKVLEEYEFAKLGKVQDFDYLQKLEEGKGE